MAKHIPKRMCIGCREMKPKEELVKFVLNENGPELDTSGKKSGRGAYICKKAECIEVAKKKRALSRHFKTAVPEELYDMAKECLNG